RSAAASRACATSVPRSYLYPRIEYLAHALAENIDRHHQGDQDDPGIEAQPVFPTEHERISVGNEQPDRRLSDRQADSEKRQRGLDRDGGGDFDRGEDTQWRKAVRQDVAQHDTRRTISQAFGRLDIFALALDQGGAARR